MNRDPHHAASARPGPWTHALLIVLFVLAPRGLAQSPFAAIVVEYQPAPGQFVNDPLFNDPAAALGRPWAGGYSEPGNSSLVSLGGFGGSITLAFDHTVLDDPANPFGLDAIVFGNALWVAGNPNRHWAECAHIEISRDANGNGLPDDAWYLIPGSHIGDPAGQWQVQGWDDDWADPTWPPEDAAWIPPGCTGFWTTAAFRLPTGIFETLIVVNPNGTDAVSEGIWGYADFAPTLRLGDTDGDNDIDDPAALPELFYTRPDDPLGVGMTPGCGGGDAFDIAWAVDPANGAPAGLAGFDFVRLTTAVNRVVLTPPPPVGELSAEIDAVADVRPGRVGDVENDGDIDAEDAAVLLECLDGPGVGVPSCPCSVLNADGDVDVDLEDVAGFQTAFAS